MVLGTEVIVHLCLCRIINLCAAVTTQMWLFFVCRFRDGFLLMPRRRLLFGFTCHIVLLGYLVVREDFSSLGLMSTYPPEQCSPAQAFSFQGASRTRRRLDRCACG